MRRRTASRATVMRWPPTRTPSRQAARRAWAASAAGVRARDRAPVHLAPDLASRPGLWHIPTVGPIVVALLIAAIVALVIVRKHRGPRWWNSRGGSMGTGASRGPRA